MGNLDLIQYLSQIVKLSEEEKALILSKFKPIPLLKNEYFLREGTICRSVGFLQKGLVRYFVHKNGEESTFEFTKEGEFISDYQSFNNKTISVQNIQAIEDCELLTIDYSSLQEVFLQTENGNLLGRIIVEHRFGIMVNQLLAVYMQDHQERYTKFVVDYSGLVQRIPQYHIASFVGVRPPSLSRIKRRHLKGAS